MLCIRGELRAPTRLTDGQSQRYLQKAKNGPLSHALDGFFCWQIGTRTLYSFKLMPFWWAKALALMHWRLLFFWQIGTPRLYIFKLMPKWKQFIYRVSHGKVFISDLRFWANKSNQTYLHNGFLISTKAQFIFHNKIFQILAF